MRQETKDRITKTNKLIASGMPKKAAMLQTGLSPSTWYKAQHSGLNAVVVTNIEKNKTPQPKRSNKVAMIIGDTHSIAQMIRDLL